MQIHAGRTMGWQLFTRAHQIQFLSVSVETAMKFIPWKWCSIYEILPRVHPFAVRNSLSLCLSLPYAMQFYCGTMAVWHMLSFDTCTQTNPKKLVATHPFEGHVLTAPLLFASMAWAVLKKQLDPNKIPSLNKV